MTLKQKLATLKVMENHGNVSRAMLEAGYDPTTAKNPKNLTDSKGFQELMEDYIPNSNLLQKHQDALEAMKPIGALVLIKNGKDGKPEQILKDNEGMIEVPDHQIRLKAVELGYKVKGKLKDDAPKSLQQFNIAGDMTLEFIGKNESNTP